MKLYVLVALFFVSSVYGGGWVDVILPDEQGLKPTNATFRGPEDCDGSWAGISCTNCNYCAGYQFHCPCTNCVYCGTSSICCHGSSAQCTCQTATGHAQCKCV